MMPETIDPKTYAFIDASNLFYGGEKSLGWKIDYARLQQEKDVLVLARGERTAREIRRFMGGRFMDFTKLKNAISMAEETGSEKHD